MENSQSNSGTIPAPITETSIQPSVSDGVGQSINTHTDSQVGTGKVAASPVDSASSSDAERIQEESKGDSTMTAGRESRSLEAIDAQTADAEAEFAESGSGTTDVGAADSEDKLASAVQAEAPKYSDSVFPLGKVPVEISVELGHFFVDASKQNTLDTGDVITLTSSTPGQVRLICNDHEVGRGELVDINGQLGVQIVRNWSA